MKRLPLTILSALSLLLCIAVSILWLRSHYTHHILRFPALGHVWQVSSLYGTLCVVMHRDTNIIPVSRLDRYAVAATFERERRFASDRLTGARVARYAAQDQYEALDARLRAGEPPHVRPRLHAARHELATAIEDESRAFARSQATDAVAKARTQAGFHRQPGDRNASSVLVMPYWSLLLLAAAPPAAHFLLHRHRAHRRRRHGRCPHCNYDLRATPTRCPECGHTPHPLREDGRHIDHTDH